MPILQILFTQLHFHDLEFVLSFVAWTNVPMLPKKFYLLPGQNACYAIRILNNDTCYYNHYKNMAFPKLHMLQPDYHSIKSYPNIYNRDTGK